jgi:hypothetical protein
VAIASGAADRSLGTPACRDAENHKTGDRPMSTTYPIWPASVTTLIGEDGYNEEPQRNVSSYRSTSGLRSRRA